MLAVLLNYLWELAQAPLYVGLERYDAAVFWHCFVASWGDGLMVLVIVAAGWLTSREPLWFVRPGVLGYVVMISTGLILAVAVEWIAVHVLGRWEYAARMPVLPGLDIGIVPIAQMLVLPPLIFRTVALLTSKKR